MPERTRYPFSAISEATRSGTSRPSSVVRVRSGVRQVLNGYVQDPALLEGRDDHIVAPGWGGRAGSLGALVLAGRTVVRGVGGSR